jgi:ABC-type phosphate transport system substrate-binding protein
MEENVMKLRILAVSIIMLVVLLAPMARAADYVLVVNKGNPASSITATEAKNMFMGKKSAWSSGHKVVPFTQSRANFHNLFVRDYTGKTSQQFATYWKKLLFTGKGIPPVDVKGDEQMKNKVASRKGSIGYISAGSLDGTVKQLVIQ